MSKSYKGLMLSGPPVASRMIRTLMDRRCEYAGMVDYRGLFVSKAGESGLIVVFTKH